MENKEKNDSILELLSEAWKKYPEFRLGQLMNIAAIRGGWNNENLDIFYTKDEMIKEGLKVILRKDNE